jgi:hypothetical protein
MNINPPQAAMISSERIRGENGFMISFLKKERLRCEAFDFPK